ncbi:Hypothetical predicted protein [Mytilus galloprovincialis]|uniref:ZP domain-containing protein n=1 Tax=Mytilus galloprovincialis TaxID=29158 RepID=A0A8B6C0R2_MYTGA|nr:Hypothetical predicted protein [Mytilus galloprovincialis]
MIFFKAALLKGNEIGNCSGFCTATACDNEGNITGLSSGNLQLGDFVFLDGNHICRLNESSCIKGKSELRVIHVKPINEQLPSIIIGGKGAQFYDLKCSPMQFDGRATASMQIAPSPATYIPNEHTYAPNSTAIALTIEKEGGDHNTEAVKLGEKLTLKFIGPAGYIVDPFNCTAFPYMVKSSTSRELWSNNTCHSLDTAILDNSWAKDGSKHNIISITLYAFRFPESTKVEIECSAHFCPESDTTYQSKCWKRVNNTIGRRRRDAVENSHFKAKDHYIKSVSTFFTVVDDSGTSNRSSGILKM